MPVQARRCVLTATDYRDACKNIGPGRGDDGGGGGGGGMMAGRGRGRGRGAASATPPRELNLFSRKFNARAALLRGVGGASISLPFPGADVYDNVHSWPLRQLAVDPAADLKAERERYSADQAARRRALLEAKAEEAAVKQREKTRREDELRRGGVLKEIADACGKDGGPLRRLAHWRDEGHRVVVHVRLPRKQGPAGFTVRRLRGQLFGCDKHFNLMLRDVEEEEYSPGRVGDDEACPLPSVTKPEHEAASVRAGVGGSQGHPNRDWCGRARAARPRLFRGMHRQHTTKPSVPEHCPPRKGASNAGLARKR